MPVTSALFSFHPYCLENNIQFCPLFVSACSNVCHFSSHSYFHTEGLVKSPKNYSNFPLQHVTMCCICDYSGWQVASFQALESHVGWLRGLWCLIHRVLSNWRGSITNTWVFTCFGTAECTEQALCAALLSEREWWFRVSHGVKIMNKTLWGVMNVSA